jgi:RNA 2',3'-cyclic 3'-phosphodiesterase
MPKLFVALDLPAAVTAELTQLQPPQVGGVRLARTSQVHLTLHYLGNAAVGRMASALQKLAMPPVPVVVEGVGQFRSPDGAVTLWAGVQGTAELLELHAAVAEALAAEGFRPEARPYSPHVTLARCSAMVAGGVVEDFLGRNRGFSLPAILITNFGLYSSEFVDGAPVYHGERLFALRTTLASEAAEL